MNVGERICARRQTARTLVHVRPNFFTKTQTKRCVGALVRGSVGLVGASKSVLWWRRCPLGYGLVQVIVGGLMAARVCGVLGPK